MILGSNLEIIFLLSDTQQVQEKKKGLPLSFVCEVHQTVFRAVQHNSEIPGLGG